MQRIWDAAQQRLISIKVMFSSPETKSQPKRPHETGSDSEEASEQHPFRKRLRRRRFDESPNNISTSMTDGEPPDSRAAQTEQLRKFRFPPLTAAIDTAGSSTQLISKDDGNGDPAYNGDVQIESIDDSAVNRTHYGQINRVSTNTSRGVCASDSMITSSSYETSPEDWSQVVRFQPKVLCTPLDMERLYERRGSDGTYLLNSDYRAPDLATFNIASLQKSNASKSRRLDRVLNGGNRRISVRGRRVIVNVTPIASVVLRRLEMKPPQSKVSSQENVQGAFDDPSIPQEEGDLKQEEEAVKKIGHEPKKDVDDPTPNSKLEENTITKLQQDSPDVEVVDQPALDQVKVLKKETKKSVDKPVPKGEKLLKKNEKSVDESTLKQEMVLKKKRRKSVRGLASKQEKYLNKKKRKSIRRPSPKQEKVLGKKGCRSRTKKHRKSKGNLDNPEVIIIGDDFTELPSAQVAAEQETIVKRRGQRSRKGRGALSHNVEEDQAKSKDDLGNLALFLESEFTVLPSAQVTADQEMKINKSGRLCRKRREMPSQNMKEEQAESEARLGIPAAVSEVYSPKMSSTEFNAEQEMKTKQRRICSQNCCDVSRQNIEDEQLKSEACLVGHNVKVAVESNDLPSIHNKRGRSLRKRRDVPSLNMEEEQLKSGPKIGSVEVVEAEVQPAELPNTYQPAPEEEEEVKVAKNIERRPMKKRRYILSQDVEDVQPKSELRMVNVEAVETQVQSGDLSNAALEVMDQPVNPAEKMKRKPLKKRRNVLCQNINEEQQICGSIVGSGEQVAILLNADAEQTIGQPSAEQPVKADRKMEERKPIKKRRNLTNQKRESKLDSQEETKAENDVAKRSSDQPALKQYLKSQGDVLSQSSEKEHSTNGKSESNGEAIYIDSAKRSDVNPGSELRREAVNGEEQSPKSEINVDNKVQSLPERQVKAARKRKREPKMSQNSGGEQPKGEIHRPEERVLSECLKTYLKQAEDKRDKRHVRAQNRALARALLLEKQQMRKEAAAVAKLQMDEKLAVAAAKVAAEAAAAAAETEVVDIDSESEHIPSSYNKVACCSFSFEMTPPRENDNEYNYNICDINVDDSTDDEAHPKRPIPCWAQVEQLEISAVNQFQAPPNYAEVFPLNDMMLPAPRTTSDIFPGYYKRYFDRR